MNSYVCHCISLGLWIEISFCAPDCQYGHRDQERSLDLCWVWFAQDSFASPHGAIGALSEVPLCIPGSKESRVPTILLCQWPNLAGDFESWIRPTINCAPFPIWIVWLPDQCHLRQGISAFILVTSRLSKMNQIIIVRQLMNVPIPFDSKPRHSTWKSVEEVDPVMILILVIFLCHAILFNFCH